MVDFIKKSHVKAIFMETTLNPKTMNEIGKEAGVRIAGTLYADQLGPSRIGRRHLYGDDAGKHAHHSGGPEVSQ